MYRLFERAQVIVLSIDFEFLKLIAPNAVSILTELGAGLLLAMIRTDEQRAEVLTTNPGDGLKMSRSIFVVLCDHRPTRECHTTIYCAISSVKLWGFGTSMCVSQASKFGTLGAD